MFPVELKDIAFEYELRRLPTQTLVKVLTLILKCNFEMSKALLWVPKWHLHMPAFSLVDERQLLKSVALRPFSKLRFIDDIDMKWSHGRETLPAFLYEANTFHPSIKFTAEISTKQHVFMDIKSSLVGDTISVYLYTKPTDTHQYLLPTSCHSKHCCKNVPYSLALRLRRICSDSDTKSKRTD